MVALVVYIAFLYVYGYYLSKLLPSNLPRWMVAGDLPLYIGTFLMPTLAHAAAVLVVRLTPEKKEHSALPSLGWHWLCRWLGTCLCSLCCRCGRVAN